MEKLFSSLSEAEMEKICGGKRAPQKEINSTSIQDADISEEAVAL